MNCLFRVTRVSKCFANLKEDFGLADQFCYYIKTFIKVTTDSSEKFITSFQFNFLNNITFTNFRLAKIGYVQEDSCTICRLVPG